ncbi:MAG: ABC transporter permease [Acidobacteria bacterium]|nr:ABC transporter permease [Acidobacteriota bacterium]
MKIRLTPLVAMVKKDLLRHLRAPLGPGLLLAFPVVFAGLLALSFGGGEPKVPKVELLIEDQDGGLVAGLIRSAFTSEQAAEYFTVVVVESGGLERMEKGEASALLRIPEGFSRHLLEQEPATLELVKNPSQSILPEIAEQVSLVLTEVLDAGAHVLDGPLSLLQPYLDDDGETVPDLAVAGIAVEVNQLVQRADKYLFPLVIELKTEERQDPEVAEPIADSQGASVFLFILPGVAVFSLFSLGDLLMRDLLREGRLGTLKRQLASPATALEVIAAKAVLTFVAGAVSLVILTAIASLAADRGIHLAAYLALAASLLLAATGTASVICGFARNERQGATISSVVYLVMAFAGGAFVPFESLPSAVRSIAPYSPFYWATEGFKSLLQAGTGLADLQRNLLVLLAVGVVTLATGTFLLGRKVRLGVAS